MDAETLHQIWLAREARDAADTHLRQVVVAAATGDDPNISAIAEAVGVTRKVIYRWMAKANPGGGDGPDVDPVAVMDQALEALLATGVQPAREAHAGLGTRIASAKARRVLLLVRNLDGRHEIDAAMRGAIDAGVLAAHRVLGHAGPGINDAVSGS